MALPPNLITNKAAKLPGDYRKQESIPRAKRQRNKTEWRYSDELEFQRLAGEILQWEFEGLRFKLADGAWYKPDFAVWLPDGRLRLVEVKGFRREAAIVRFKVARDKYPHCEWLMVQRVKGAWERIF